MGTVTVPALVVLPRYWLAEARGLGAVWLEEWLPWQFCATVLPVALHRACVHRGDEFAQDFGELAVYLMRLTHEQYRAFGELVDGKALPLDSFDRGPIPAELVYTDREGLDPADALSVVFTGDAVRAEVRRDELAAAACGVGAALAGLASGTVSAHDPQKPGRSGFVPQWEGIIAAGKYLTADDFPERLADVPGFLNDCRRKWPELFQPASAR